MTTARRAALPLLLLAPLAACASGRAPLPPWEPVPEPAVEDVESIIFLIGDPGESDLERAPVLAEIEVEVERWSEWLGRDSAVAVLILGDVVYPRGLRAPGSAEYPRDSIRVEAQIDMFDGPRARAHQAAGYFIPGNHDWGKARGIEGKQRLQNLDDFLDRARQRGGVNVDLVPPAGEPGPGIIDIGPNLRMILLDTAWWLLAASPEPKRALIQRIEAAMREAGDRSVLIAAHHPWRTAGPHGGTVNFWRTFGVRWLLHKTGALLQDINSRPMQDLRRELEGIFARVGPPLLFVGGHDHSLQVLQGVTPTEPRWIVVSGTGSKVTRVGNAPGMRFRADKAGFLRLMVLRDGSGILYARGADEEWIGCPNEIEPDTDTCMAAAPAAFETLFSIRLEP